MPTLLRIDHVHLTVPRDDEAAACAFYGELLGLERIPKPIPSRGGAWYRLGGAELHLSPEDVLFETNLRSKRHVCLIVDDVAAFEADLRAKGVEIVPDDNPVPGWQRFYVRDPGGNRVEIAMRGNVLP